VIKSFQLAARKYKVNYAKDDSNNLGLSKSPLCEVTVQTIFAGREVPEISQEQTLYHEVVHCILDEIGRNDLSDDETFVQSFAGMMHQFAKTKK